MLNRAAATAIVLLAACGDSPPERAIVVRVSATAGLEALEPGPDLSGSAASAIDLVFDPLAAHGEVKSVQGRTVTIHVRNDAEVLGRKLRFRGLQRSQVRGEEVTATLIDEKSAMIFADSKYPVVDSGPFRVDHHEPGIVRLVRRTPHPVSAIEIVETSQSDEWRKLMARELDIIPAASSAFRRELDEITSIRVFDIPSQSDVTLYFNLRDPILRDVAVRRSIASSINRDALGRLACGDESCAAPSIAPLGDVELPEKLTLSVIESNATLVSAARALKFQLGERGVDVTLRPATVADLIAGDFQVTITPLVRGRYRYLGFVSPAVDKPSVTGFSSEAFDRAVAADDPVSAQRILDDQLPVTILFEYRQFAAVDAGLCGDVTPSATSWRWIADLRPCEEDE